MDNVFENDDRAAREDENKDALFDVLYFGRLRPGVKPRELIFQAAKHFNMEPKAVQDLLKQKKAKISSDLPKDKADKVRIEWAKLGVICSIQANTNKKQFNLEELYVLCTACGQKTPSANPACDHCHVVIAKYIKTMKRKKEEALLRKKMSKQNELQKQKDSEEEERYREERRIALELENKRKRNIFSKIIQYWNDLEKKQQYILGGGFAAIILIITISITLNFVLKDNRVDNKYEAIVKSDNHFLTASTDLQLDKDRLYADSVQSLVKSGKTDKAEMLLDNIQNMTQKIQATSVIAKSLMQNGNADGAKIKMENLMGMVGQISESNQQIEMSHLMAQAYHDIGDQEKSVTIINNVQQQMGSQSQIEQGKMHLDTALIQHKVGNKSESKAALKKAIELLGTATPESEKLKSQAKAAFLYALQGDDMTSEQLFSEIVKASYSLKNKKVRDQVLSAVAMNQLNASDFRTALQTAFQISSSEIQNETLFEMIKMNSEKGGFSELLDVVSSMSDKKLQIKAYLYVSDKQSNAGEKENAKKSLQLAKQQVDALDDSQVDIGLVTDLAKQAAKNDDEIMATAFFQKAINMAEQEQNVDKRDEIMKDIISVQAYSNQFEMGLENAESISSDVMKAHIIAEIKILQKDYHQLMQLQSNP